MFCHNMLYTMLESEKDTTIHNTLDIYAPTNMYEMLNQRRI